MKNFRSNDLPIGQMPSRLLTSSEVKYLLGIKSNTTLIKYETRGKIKVHGRIGNQKRYSSNHISKLMNTGVDFS